MQRLNLKHLLIAFAIGCSFFGLAPNIVAQAITYQFDGTLNYTPVGFNNVDFVDFSGQFSVDYLAPDQNPNPTEGLFELTNVSVTFDDGFTPEITQGEIVQSFFSGQSFQRIEFNELFTVNSMFLVFSSDFLDANSLATIDFGEFEGGEATRNVIVGTGNIGGVVGFGVQAVPEPGSILGLLLIVGGLACWRTR